MSLSRPTGSVVVVESEAHVFKGSFILAHSLFVYLDYRKAVLIARSLHQFGQITRNLLGGVFNS
jgi:hypothetical protein